MAKRSLYGSLVLSVLVGAMGSISYASPSVNKGIIKSDIAKKRNITVGKNLQSPSTKKESMILKKILCYEKGEFQIFGVSAHNIGRMHELTVIYAKKGIDGEIVDVLSNKQLNAKTYYFKKGEILKFRVVLVDLTTGQKFQEVWDSGMGSQTAEKKGPSITINAPLVGDGLISANGTLDLAGKKAKKIEVVLAKKETGKMTKVASQLVNKFPVSFDSTGLANGSYRLQVFVFWNDPKDKTLVAVKDFTLGAASVAPSIAPTATAVPQPSVSPSAEKEEDDAKKEEADALLEKATEEADAKKAEAEALLKKAKEEAEAKKAETVIQKAVVLPLPAVETYWNVQSLNRKNSVEFNDGANGLRSFTGIAIGVKTPFGLSADFGPGYSNIGGYSVIGLNLNVEYQPVKYLKFQNQSLLGPFLADGRFTGYNIAKAMGQYPIALPVGELVPAFGVEALAYPASPTTAHLTVGPFLQLGYSYKGFGIEAFYAYDRFGYSTTPASFAGGLNIRWSWMSKP